MGQEFNKTVNQNWAKDMVLQSQPMLVSTERIYVPVFCSHDEWAWRPSEDRLECAKCKDHGPTGQQISFFAGHLYNKRLQRGNEQEMRANALADECGKLADENVRLNKLNLNLLGRLARITGCDPTKDK